MGKPSGGGGATGSFTTTATGSGTVGIELWIDLGVIPLGYRYWIGFAQFSSIDKVLGFDLRPNLTTKGTGTIVNTSLVATASLRAGTSKTLDLYKGGALHTTTALGTGVEHWWLRLYSKSASLGSYMYKISYTLE
jgi:hypothetical protein